jgi:predicted PurR-regulated permease PerM
MSQNIPDADPPEVAMDDAETPQDDGPAGEADTIGSSDAADDSSKEAEPVVTTNELVVVPRWVQAVMVAVALFALVSLARAAAPVLLFFLVSAVVALVINPLVLLLQRARVPRGLAIAAVFLGFFALVAGVVALLLAQAFQADLPTLIDSANASLAKLQGWLDRRGLDIHIKSPGETALGTLQSSILRGSGDVVSFTRDLVTGVIEASFALILVLVITIYMLIYGQQIGALARQWMPPGNGSSDDDYPTQVQRAVSGYVRAQLTFSAIMGFSAGVSLWLFGAFGIFPAGRSYAVFFGVFYGLMELIPYLGPVLGAAPAILVALLQGEPLTALWLLILFVVLQQLEGHVVAPLIFSHSLRINPLLVIFALLFGAHLHGIPGALIALPITAILRETAIYLRRHLLMEPWGTPTAAAITAPATRVSPASHAVMASRHPLARLAKAAKRRRRGLERKVHQPDDTAGR